MLRSGRPAKRRRLGSEVSLARSSQADLASVQIAARVEDAAANPFSEVSQVQKKPDYDLTPGEPTLALGTVMSPQDMSLCLSLPAEREAHLCAGPSSSKLDQPSMETSQPQSRPQPIGRAIAPAPRSVVPAAGGHQWICLRDKYGLKHKFTSPFKGCVDSLKSLQYPRPVDGQVNGYVKLNWLPVGVDKTALQVIDVTDEMIRRGRNGVRIYHQKSPAASDDTSTSDCLICSSTASSGLVSGPRQLHSSTPICAASLDAAISPVTLHGALRVCSPPSEAHKKLDGLMAEAPMKVPPHFGHGVAMDHVDRKFWSFYIQNWCPGRSVLKATNFWLNEFAPMHDLDSVRAAIQSLAGIYIYDYQPQDVVRRRVSERFVEAESRLSVLLERAAHLDSRESRELITLLSILSMQDIVLTERRLKRPWNPRWLNSFQQGEYFLDATDLGHRFWKKENVQLDSLRNAQSIIVGRGVILAQPMMPLSVPATFDPIAEANRFGWLLCGSQKDMYEIHGGCGFSRCLLHIFSQVTYCAARLSQYSESLVVPETAKPLHQELMSLRQWSRESTEWSVAEHKPQPITWVRDVEDDYVIRSSREMTDITAEAWRIAGLLYLQCRLMRLPRDSPDVLINLEDLAKCIRIMPTSGYVFTAQAPLLPVFFLGLLATVPEHQSVAMRWFEGVIHTPVRSSVPPLYDALQRILRWLPNEVNISALSADTKISKHVAERPAWWENMVAKIQKKEPEVLCLT